MQFAANLPCKVFFWEAASCHTGMFTATPCMACQSFFLRDIFWDTPSDRLMSTHKVVYSNRFAEKNKIYFKAVKSSVGVPTLCPSALACDVHGQASIGDRSKVTCQLVDWAMKRHEMPWNAWWNAVSFFVRLCSSRIPASRRVVFFVVWEARSSTGEAKPTVSFGKSFESFAFCFFPMFWANVDKHMIYNYIYTHIFIYNYVYMQYAVCKFSTFWPTVFWHRRECGICLNGPSRCTRTLCLGCLVNIVGICRNL